MNAYRITTSCAGENPVDAFERAMPGRTLQAVKDPKQATVRVELMNGTRKSVNYYRAVDKGKGGAGISTVDVKGRGYFEVMLGCDPNYPGVDVEFISSNDDSKNKASRPRVVFEYPKDGGLRMLIWADRDSEDYTDIIEFDKNGNRK